MESSRHGHRCGSWGKSRTKSREKSLSRTGQERRGRRLGLSTWEHMEKKAGKKQHDKERQRGRESNLRKDEKKSAFSLRAFLHSQCISCISSCLGNPGHECLSFLPAASIHGTGYLCHVCLLLLRANNLLGKLISMAAFIPFAVPEKMPVPGITCLICNSDTPAFRLVCFYFLKL